ncbi:hypothetical protein MMC32_004548 [Xylographa parallela]|nr:hypothetical protein [Xylographa parallela]
MAHRVSDVRLGVKTRVFHLGDYRRATVGPGQDVPHDYFFVNGEEISDLGNCEVSAEALGDASASSVLLRQKILRKCREDIYHFFDKEKGQIAIYDAVNPLAAGRRVLAKEFAKHDVQYVGWTSDDAVQHYLARITAKIPHFETMNEPELNYIKMINAGERLSVNNCSFGYLSHRIVFYLLNLHIKSRHTYFARAGNPSKGDSYKLDASLAEQGIDYARKMGNTLIEHREEERQALMNRGGPDTPLKSLTIWTSPRRRTVETAHYLQEKGYRVRQRSQMSQLNPGVCEKMSERRIRLEYPDEVQKHEADPYHHRYPRAESYHDLAVRLEPIILELEREQNDLLIIAHESVLRVLYGYLMACNATDIPTLSFPRNEIIEIIPASYNNKAKRIHIPDLPDEIIPASPEDIRIPVASSGVVSPMDGLGSPMSGAQSPMDGNRSPDKGYATPKDSGSGTHLLVERALRGV